ncbi:SUMF1/EgtB/PvdO family nonheme iron enzyme [candidate division WOR-3 bacterium]|nr:SUMF1/EgtB/PvdO family nonheme iron enzyme [candidate division WOR-3 bacterium]
MRFICFALAIIAVVIGVSCEGLTPDDIIGKGYGNLLITSEPTGCTVYINDSKQDDTTNCVIDSMPREEELIVRLTKDDYIDWVDTVQIEDEDTVKIDAVLDKDIPEIEWIHVPAGSFYMGCPEWDEDAYDDEMPQHSVYLNGYYISKYEITNAQFCEFLNENGNLYQGFECIVLEGGWELCQIYESSGKYYVDAGKEDYPVIDVTWYGAKGFCQWIGGRLPTEAEWEKAARGTDMRKYPWGDEDPTEARAKYGDPDSTRVNTVPVGYYTDGVSAYGCFEMAGNVAEWVADWYYYDYYEESPEENPPRPETGSYKVFRGGCWYWWYDSDLRCTDREKDYPYLAFIDLGFRPVKDE